MDAGFAKLATGEWGTSGWGKAMTSVVTGVLFFPGGATMSAGETLDSASTPLPALDAYLRHTYTAASLGHKCGW